MGHVVDGGEIPSGWMARGITNNFRINIMNRLSILITINQVNGGTANSFCSG